MHDAAPKYEPDTVVVDLDDIADAMPSLGRVSTEDLVAHVIVLGQRHRRTPDLRETACGVPIHSQYVAPLREQLTLRDGALCPDCFTPHEHARANENDVAAFEAEQVAEGRRRRDSERRHAKSWPLPTADDDDNEGDH